MGGRGSGMEDKRWGKRRTLRLGKTSGKVEGALWRKIRGNSLRKASVDKRDGHCGWEIGWEKWKERYGGKIVEIAFEKHLWRRGTGRDGRGGWEIGWEKWKERTGGRSVEGACEKHLWRRGTGRDGRCGWEIG